jgi:hypothetical protein
MYKYVSINRYIHTYEYITECTKISKTRIDVIDATNRKHVVTSRHIYIEGLIYYIIQTFSGFLSGSNFCIFIEKDSNLIYEIFCKWIKTITKSLEEEYERKVFMVNKDPTNVIEVKKVIENEFIVARKGHLLKIKS